jgi:hypothetical protein
VNAPAPLHFKQQLADELHARATTLTELTGHHARARAPRRWQPLTLGAVAAALAVAVAVPLAATTHNARPAADPSAAPTAPTTHRTGSDSLDIVTADYVVKSIPDGTIAVEVMNSKGIPGLQAALRQAGIPAAVMGFSASCHTTVLTDDSNAAWEALPQPSPTSGLNGHFALIKPSAVPKGEHLLFEATVAPNGQVGTLQISVVRQVPSCVPQSQDEIGEGYVAPGTNP